MIWFWLILGVVLILVELVLPGAVVVFLGFGALAVALAIYLGLVEGWMSAFTLWFIGSLLLLIILRSFLQRYMPQGEAQRQSTDEDLDAYGAVITVAEAMSPDQAGRIHFRGTTWPGICYEKALQSGEKAAGSTGRCNTCIKCFCRSCELQRLAWPLVELPSNRVQMFL